MTALVKSVENDTSFSIWACYIYLLQVLRIVQSEGSGENAGVKVHTAS